MVLNYSRLHFYCISNINNRFTTYKINYLILSLILKHPPLPRFLVKFIVTMK